MVSDIQRYNRLLYELRGVADEILHERKNHVYAAQLHYLKKHNPSKSPRSLNTYLDLGITNASEIWGVVEKYTEQGFK